MPFIAYKITHKESGKSYIGITTRTLAYRWKRHCGDGQRGIGMAIRKYGKAAFDWEHVASATSLDNLLELERALIAQEGTLVPRGYNLCGGGEGQFSPSEETKTLLRETRKRYKPTPETIEKMRVAGLNRPPPSEESRRKNAESQRLRKLRGTFTPEVIAKLRSFRHTESTKEKMRALHVSRGEEWRSKVSRALLGNTNAKAQKGVVKRTEEQKRKIALTLTGRKVSEEIKSKQSASIKAWWAARKAAALGGQGVL
jgi:hypothetical protein